MIIEVSHRLSFAALAGQRAVAHLLLTPLSGPRQTVKEWSIAMPGIETAARFTDAYGNRALLVTQGRAEETIPIVVRGRVEVQQGNGVLGRVPGEPVVGLYLRPTAATGPQARLVQPFADAGRQGGARIALFHDLMARLGEVYRFAPAPPDDGPRPLQAQGQGSADHQSQNQNQSQGSGAIAETAGSGSDEPEPADAARFAHAFIGTLRALGLPARYVTGYLAGDEAHPAAVHAWAEAYDDGLGWIAFDAALGLCPTDRHVRVAVGLDAASTEAVRVAPALGAPALIEIEVIAQ